MLNMSQLYDYLINNFNAKINGDTLSVDLSKTNTVYKPFIYDNGINLGTCRLIIRKVRLTNAGNVTDQVCYSVKIYSYRHNEYHYGYGTRITGDVNEGELSINVTGDMPMNLVIRRKECSRTLILPVSQWLLGS